MLLLALLALQTTPTLPPGNHNLSLHFGDRTRRFIVHTPPQVREGRPLPVVLSFHGGGGTARGTQEYTGTDSIADREGFIVVYPEIDQRRVYATGLSNGGMMSYRLAAELGDRIAAIAPIAGGMVVDSIRSPRPVPIMHIHSVDDPRALYAGGVGPSFPFTNIRVVHPVMDSVIARWVRFDGCPATPVVGETIHGRAGSPSAGHTATPIRYAPCARSGEIVLWKLTGAGHVWPGAGVQSWQKYVGPATDVIGADTLMWRFFQRFSLPESH